MYRLKYYLKFVLVFKVLFMDMEVNAQTFNTTASNRVEKGTLDSSINIYHVFSFSTPQLLNYLESSRSISDQIELNLIPGVTWNFNIESVALLDDVSEVVILTESGKTFYKKHRKTKAYQGVFSDGRDGFIRLTINDGFMYGMINEAGTEYFIEPLNYYSQKASDDQFVIYKAQDVKQNKSRFECFRPASQQKYSIDKTQLSKRNAGNCYKAKLAILADYSMYIDSAHPGVDAVIDHIVGVINNCQGDFIYDADKNFNDGINFEISEIVISTCISCDPLSSQTNAGTLLSDFSEWIDQGGFYQQFHAAQFWTNRDLNSSTVGVAFQSPNLYCQSKARALFEDWSSNAALLRTTVSHEMGHTFNGVHDGSGTNFILTPTISVNNVTWSPASKTAISVEIANQGPSCLLPCNAISCPKVENLAISNITSQSFTISWSSTSQNLYNVRVKEVGAANFILDYISTSSVQILSPPGYGICKKYDVYVYNNCSANGLSALVRIINIGTTLQGCADFTVNKKVGWRGSPFQFTDKSLNATSWFWNFGDGQTSTQKNPGVSYLKAGSYNISLTVNGVHTIIKNAEITILPDLTTPFLSSQGGNFESNDNYFASSVHEGSKNLWQLGISNYRLKTSGKAWKTGLNTEVGQVTSKSALYSPRFDLSGYRNFTLSFDMSMEVIYCNGPFSAQLQYSINNGETWTRLGNSPGFYNAGPTTSCPISTFVFADATGWTINADYLTKSIDISFLAGIPTVIFRFETSVSGIFQLGYNIDGLLIDNFKIEAANPGVLALDTKSLKAKISSKNVQLNWETSDVSDIVLFHILKSRDGLSFELIDSLHNSADKTQFFNYLDTKPFEYRNYYKIAALHIDGRTTFTNIARVQFENEDILVLSPNPITQGQKLNINCKDLDINTSEIKLIDITGKLIVIPENRLKNSFLDTDFLEPSVYVLNIKTHDGKIQKSKFVVIR